MIVKYIKEAGHTMNQTIDKYKKENNINEKVCYCGRLDPMARGLVYLLVGDNCKDMEKHLQHKKEYQFEILFGLSTDTDDPLGIINNHIVVNYEDVNKYKIIIHDFIENLIKKPFNQNFHDYSSKRVKGKPLWEYKKNNIKIDKPSHSVTIDNYHINEIKKYNSNDWINNIINTINKIDKKNDFRQENIINQYNLTKLSNDIYTLPITITVSSGFYVRQLVSDIKNHINIPILTYDINRLNVLCEVQN